MNNLPVSISSKNNNFLWVVTIFSFRWKGDMIIKLMGVVQVFMLASERFELNLYRLCSKIAELEWRHAAKF